MEREKLKFRTDTKGEEESPLDCSQVAPTLLLHLLCEELATLEAAFLIPGE